MSQQQQQRNVQFLDRISYSNDLRERAPDHIPPMINNVPVRGLPFSAPSSPRCHSQQDHNRLDVETNLLRDQREIEKKKLKEIQVAIVEEQKKLDIVKEQATLFSSQCETSRLECSFITSEIGKEKAKLERLQAEVIKSEEELRSNSDDLQYNLDEIKRLKLEISNLLKESNDMQLSTAQQRREHQVYLQHQSIYRAQEKINTIMRETVKEEDEPGSSRKRTRSSTRRD